jgi:hypothetical protein
MQAKPAPAEETIDALLGGLSFQDQQRILRNLLWDVFGDIDDEGHEIIDPNRKPDRVDVESLLTSLQMELWGEYGSAD